LPAPRHRAPREGLPLRGARRAPAAVGKPAGRARAPRASTPIGQITKQSHRAGLVAGCSGPGSPRLPQARGRCVRRLRGRSPRAALPCYAPTRPGKGAWQRARCGERAGTRETAGIVPGPDASRTRGERGAFLEGREGYTKRHDGAGRPICRNPYGQRPEQTTHGPSNRFAPQVGSRTWARSPEEPRRSPCWWRSHRSRTSSSPAPRS
jgi:hypothetical protein